jgi:hypothetical protein
MCGRTCRSYGAKSNWEIAAINMLLLWSKNKAKDMYRRPKFLEVLHAIREEMSREADYDVDLFTEMVRSGTQPSHGPQRVIRGFRTRAPRAENTNGKPAKHRQRKRSA